MSLGISLTEFFLRLFKGKTKQETLWKITTISKQRYSHSSLQCSNWVLNSRDLRVPCHVKKTEVSLRNRTFNPHGHFLVGRSWGKSPSSGTITHEIKLRFIFRKSFPEKSTREMWSLGSIVEGLDGSEKTSYEGPGRNTCIPSTIMCISLWTCLWAPGGLCRCISDFFSTSHFLPTRLLSIFLSK